LSEEKGGGEAPLKKWCIGPGVLAARTLTQTEREEKKGRITR